MKLSYHKSVNCHRQWATVTNNIVTNGTVTTKLLADIKVTQNNVHIVSSTHRVQATC